MLWADNSHIYTVLRVATAATQRQILKFKTLIRTKMYVTVCVNLSRCHHLQNIYIVLLVFVVWIPCMFIKIPMKFTGLQVLRPHL